MAVFDTLPEKIRAALRDSLFDWNHQEIADGLASGYTMDQIVEIIHRGDERKGRIDEDLVWNSPGLFTKK